MDYPISSMLVQTHYGSPEIFFISLIAKNLKHSPATVYNMLLELNYERERTVNRRNRKLAETKRTILIEKI